ncbi:TA system VapC family ribonuclease toxin [Pseudoduganella sp.]|uniref:TA system VapC family ribonuclease toxin n=1 Tax=Pseudoduganella sp. TaxID=1880898 RepID=UPI0035B4C357
MTYLLDVNVLIALIDTAHIQHGTAKAWFASVGQVSWATCPLTENGVLRIVGNPRYPNSPGSPILVMPLLRALRVMPGHTFWPDDLSLVASRHVQHHRLYRSHSITDTYLLALARANNGKLATFPDGVKSLQLL